MRSLLFVVFLLPFIAGAHGAGDVTQKENNGYLLSVGSADEFIYAGEAGRLNIEIETKAGVAFEGWSGVWTRIMSPDGTLLFAGNIERGKDGLIAGMSYLFLKPGTYDIALRFMNREHTIAEASFDFIVLEKKTPHKYTWLLPLLVVLAGIGLKKFLFIKKRKSS